MKHPAPRSYVTPTRPAARTNDLDRSDAEVGADFTALRPVDPDLDAGLRRLYCAHGGTDLEHFAEDVHADLANLRPGAHPRLRPRHWQRSRLEPELRQLASHLAALSPEARAWLSYTCERPEACAGDSAAACMAERRLLRETDATDLVDELVRRASLPVPTPPRMDPIRWECAWRATRTLKRHELSLTRGRNSLFTALLKRYLEASGKPDTDPYQLARDWLAASDLVESL